MMALAIKNLIATILIAVSAFIFWTNILPKYEGVSALRPVIEEKKSLLASRIEIVEKLKNLQKEYENRYNELQRLALVAPRNKSIPEFISTIEDISSKTGNIPTIVKLSDRKTVGEAKSLNIVSFEINLEGTYEALLNFLDSMEKNIRLVDIEVLTIGATTRINVSGSVVINSLLKGSMYVLKPELGAKNSSFRQPIVSE